MTKIDREELLPCAHCGGLANMVSGAPGCHFVICTVCKMSTDDRSYDAAVSRWNRRTSPVGGWEPAEGFVLVPREPTDAMIEAGLESLADSTGEPTAHIDRDPLLCYRAMLHAAAQPGGEK